MAYGLEAGSAWLDWLVGLTWQGRKSGEARGSVGRAFNLFGLLERRIVNSEVDRFCYLFAPLRVELLVSVCFILWAERLTRRPKLEIENRRRPRDLRSELS
ncbi:hypothetical protein CRG98_037263 [Punica granatum]|uniref:Uncharacterized protein n=1 Tax=Punica granatum TaxID=22663 RepID=A0A2I0IEB6_PUNGR|nr:hypothetical protein CRG98_037263 [Punica granatum]